MFDADLCLIDWVSSLNNNYFVGTDRHVAVADVIDDICYVFRFSVEMCLLLAGIRIYFVALDLP